MIHTYDFEEAVPGASRVAFGSFDGLHIGHRAVIGKLCGYETQTPVVLSFEENEKPIIYSEDEKEYFLKDSRVEIMVSMPVKDAYAMTGEEFAKEILAEKLQAKSVVAGENISFGSEGLGIDALKEFGEKYGFAVDVIPTVSLGGEPVTTDRVKKAIEDGDFRRMNVLLGHAYLMRGTVVHGKAAGRKVGMPTANLGVAKNKLFPPHGVYGTLSYMDGTFFRGMTNIGLRPSDDDVPIATIETFLLDFDRDIYGKDIKLEIHADIRGVKKFANLEEVKKQVDKDIEAVRVYMDGVIYNMKK